MKKTGLVLAAIFALAGLTATAQKSTNYLVGSVAYSKSTGVDASYSFSPLVGYYVTNKTSVGLLGELGKSSDETITNVGAFVRNDFTKVGKNCDVFAQLSVISQTSKPLDDISTTAFVSNVGLGANYFLNSKWSLTMNLADVITYRSVSGMSSFKIGFGNIVNPFSTANIGLVYKF